ncbi:MAG TPA: thiamine pyrophosphate-dependent dehydrogenase E1 component subunit alpha [Xanthobacteraceae bacterium]|jgi:pyruvate dehydrogenase E1 component alpha subunit
MSNAAQTRLELYRMMYLIRRAEEALMAEYHPADEMRCPMHFCVGQEAMPAALARVIRSNDILMSHYRSHGYYLAKGAPLDAMVAEFYGKRTGANLGIAGSMELASHAHNFYSGAIVGGSLYMPFGGAFAQKYRGGEDISVSVIGDGVFDEGITYEIFNLAALYRLPLLIICENNKYAAHTPVEKRQAVVQLSDRAQSFGIPFEKHDGYDAALLLQTLERIVPEIRAGGGPRCIEIATYRFCGHVGPGEDEGMGYRSAEEIKHWKLRDPVASLRRELAPAHLEALQQLETDIETDIRSAISAAKRADWPKLEEIIAFNTSGEYSGTVEFTGTRPAAFRAGQSEAMPGPF